MKEGQFSDQKLSWVVEPSVLNFLKAFCLFLISELSTTASRVKEIAHIRNRNFPY